MTLAAENVLNVENLMNHVEQEILSGSRLTGYEIAQKFGSAQSEVWKVLDLLSDEMKEKRKALPIGSREARKKAALGIARKAVKTDMANGYRKDIEPFLSELAQKHGMKTSLLTAGYLSLSKAVRNRWIKLPSQSQHESIRQAVEAMRGKGVHRITIESVYAVTGVSRYRIKRWMNSHPESLAPITKVSKKVQMIPICPEGIRENILVCMMRCLWDYQDGKILTLPALDEIGARCGCKRQNVHTQVSETEVYEMYKAAAKESSGKIPEKIMPRIEAEVQKFWRSKSKKIPTYQSLALKLGVSHDVVKIAIRLLPAVVKSQYFAMHCMDRSEKTLQFKEMLLQVRTEMERIKKNRKGGYTSDRQLSLAYGFSNPRIDHWLKIFLSEEECAFRKKIMKTPARRRDGLLFVSLGGQKTLAV